MMKNPPLSTDQTAALLDNAPVAVYVSALDNWELLYANRMAKGLFLRNPNEQGGTCYQAAGFDQPCFFCKMDKLSASQLRVREFRHPINQRVYQLSGKLIDWAGRPAHIEYILDITEKKREEERSQELKTELQETFSNIPCGLCVYRFDGERIYPLFHNPAFYRIMGYSAEHIQAVEQDTNYLGVHSEDLERLKRKIQEAIRQNGVTQHTYRLWNDTKGEYRWIHLEGSVKAQEDGTKLLYGVYSDVSEQARLEQELTDASEKMQDIVNAIPGGVAIYKVTDIFQTIYFSDGVPELTGYSVEEYQELIKRDATEMVYWEDTAMVISKAEQVIQTHEIARVEFRKQHRDGHVVWVRAQVKWIGDEDGCPLLHCVFHNITDFKEAQQEMAHLINSIPGGIASYQVEGDRFIPTFFSDGVMSISGHTREEYEELIRHNALDLIYEPDRERVLAAAKNAIWHGTVLDAYYRMRHKDGSLIWVHFNGRRMGPLTENTRFYAVFTGMSAETRLFQSIANETADGIYVISKENYELLYSNESKSLFMKDKKCLGQKCYETLHGKSAPCEFCTLKSHMPDGEEHEMPVDGTGRFYATRFRETDWNGIPSYVKYVRDITEEVHTRKEKERLEMYFQTVIKNLPGGISVIRYDPDGRLVPEFISDGFATMTRMTVEQAYRLYQHDILIGIHPEDVGLIRETLQRSMESGEDHCELTGRVKCGDGGYIWVKSTLSVLQSTDGIRRLYSVYTDISKNVEEKEQIRKQYNELILRHYRTPGPDALIVGHCNITQNRIIEIIDHTNSDLLKTFGTVREEFFTGVAGLVVEPNERRKFLDTYLNAPALAAFERNETEQILECFIKLPREPNGRYAQFKMNMVATPDTGGVTGILTVTDVTEQTINNRILHQLSVTNYDFVIDLNLNQDTYTILTCNKNASCVPNSHGCHSKRLGYMLSSAVVPKDKDRYARALAPDEIRRKLTEEGPYTFSFSITDEHGDIRTKNMTVSAIDLRLGRVCMVRTDITDSVREQQGLLNMIAYTFELAGFINRSSDCLTLYTRKTVLENLSPFSIQHYNKAVPVFAERYSTEEERKEVENQLSVATMVQRLEEKPEGYDFVFSYQSGAALRYKQINVLWGDENHRTICLVRADVTDMLAAERQTKKALEKALTLAEEANHAKSDFLSTMSHDIRTPMNAIMGMTALAAAHLDEKARVEDCLHKISVSSKHLLSLINDVLDMSKIERSKITLNRMEISIPELIEQLSAMMTPQAVETGLRLDIQTKEIAHKAFYGDALRLNQILINILSNAIKFTPAGGQILFLVEEISPVKTLRFARYRFTIQDTGVGMPQEFLAHIFEPFSRSRATARVEGTGLGLSITKGLVDLMEGSISVDSQVEKGTCFQVELECEIAPAPGAFLTEERKPQIARMEMDGLFLNRCFLVAEDNAINAEILCELLKLSGAKTVVRTDGKQAVQAFLDAPPGTFDAVLMDIQMPAMNGYEATRAIRGLERNDAKEIPIIAMTANAFSEDVQAALNAGMNAHVAKPIDIDVLKNTITRVLHCTP